MIIWQNVSESCSAVECTTSLDGQNGEIWDFYLSLILMIIRHKTGLPSYSDCYQVRKWEYSHKIVPTEYFPYFLHRILWQHPHNCYNLECQAKSSTWIPHFLAQFHTVLNSLGYLWHFVLCGRLAKFCNNFLWRIFSICRSFLQGDCNCQVGKFICQSGK